jgi:predicted aspartyl protease
VKRLTDDLPARERAHVHPDFLANEASYWQVRDSLLATYKGKWVAVESGRVVAEATDVLDILERVEAIGGHPYIALVGNEHRKFTVRRAFAYDLSYQPFPLPRVPATFAARQGASGTAFDDVILDTGADLTLLPERDGEQIGLRTSPYLTGVVRGIVGPSTTALVYRGIVEVAGHSCRSLISLIRGPERILGRDVLNQLRVTLDGPAGRIEID